MSNCLECGKENPPSKGRKKRKYCSPKCANKYLHRKNYNNGENGVNGYTYAKKNPDWGLKTKELNERRAEFEQCESDPNLFSMKDICKLANLEKSNVSQRYKKLGIIPARSIAYTGNKPYFSREQVDQILDYENQMYPMPAGCITTQEVLALLDITALTFLRRRTFIDLEPEGTIVRNGSPNEYYNKNKVIQFETDWQQRQVDRKEEVSQRQKERLEQIQREQKEYEEWFTKETEGLLSGAEFASACGTKFPPNFIEADFRCKKTKAKFFHPDRVKEHKERKEKHLNSLRIDDPAYGRMKSGFIRRTPLRKGKWTDPKPYVERRLKLEEFHYNKYSKSRQKLVDQFKKNVILWKGNGYTNPKTYKCKTCLEQKPFYEYYRDRKSCKECITRPKNNKPMNIRSRVATAFVITIKQELSKANKKYEAIPNPILWDEIEKVLGYNKEQYLNHLESQFEPWMEWSCWGRTRRNKDGKCWEIDHIIPRSKYEYTSIDSPEFKEIWDLKNLRPISRRDNLEKGVKEVCLETSSI